jgi:hypothetical protein
MHSLSFNVGEQPSEEQLADGESLCTLDTALTIQYSENAATANNAKDFAFHTVQYFRGSPSELSALAVLLG